MEHSRTSLFNIDFTLLISTFLLMFIGVLFVYSSGINSAGELVSNEYLKQLVWVLLAVVVMVVLSFINYRTYYDLFLLLYVGFLLLLAATLIFGKIVNGAKSWLGIGDLGIQPSEFAKITTAIFLAKFFSDNKQDIHKLSTLFKAALIVGFPMVLILAQPDLGTSFVFAFIFLATAFIAGVPTKHILFLLSFGLLTLLLAVIPFYFEKIAMVGSPLVTILTDFQIVAVLAGVLLLIVIMGFWGSVKYKLTVFYWITYIALILFGALAASYVLRGELAEYQIKRFVIFLNPYVDSQGAGWNIIQSLNAVGSGGFSGKGFLQGTQSHLRYLPMQSTDFIFSILAEEWGFLGGLAVFSLYGIILWRAMNLIMKVKDTFAANLTAGLIGMIFFHMFFNVGMTMGMVPITGIPLYFLSYGGSHLITGAVAIGIVSNIYHRRFLF